MTFKFNHELRGGHVHIAVFSGKDHDHLGKCGDLVMRAEEWHEFNLSMDYGAEKLGYTEVIFEDQAPPSDPGGKKVLVYPKDPKREGHI